MQKAVKYILFCFTLLIVYEDAKSQKPDFKRHEIEINYSYFTTAKIINNIYDKLYGFGDHNDNYLFNNNFNSYGAAYFTYRFNLLKKMSLGITCGVDFSNADIVDNRNAYFGNTRKTYLTSALECKYKYADKKIVSFYGFLGIGYSWLFTKDNYIMDPQGMKFVKMIKNHLDGQITPIGIRIGKTFGGFIELGIGYKGFLNAGLSLNI